MNLVYNAILIILGAISLGAIWLLMLAIKTALSESILNQDQDYDRHYLGNK